ncbi:MAG: type I methionyl aminopeptidase [Myxococcota bacterium]
MHVLHPRELRKMRRAGRAAAATLDAACALVRPGLSTDRIDAFVAADTARRGGRCSQHGHRVGERRFPGHVCVSPNDVVCHGVPSPHVVLRDGDIVNIDVTTELEGWHGDTSRTVFVGEPGPEARHVVEVARRALEVGIAQVRPGAPMRAIGRAIEAFARSEGCTVVEDYGGHGIGRMMHEPPTVPHVDTGFDGPRMRVGACFTIEPMVCLGGATIRHDP